MTTVLMRVWVLRGIPAAVLALGNLVNPGDFIPPDDPWLLAADSGLGVVW